MKSLIAFAAMLVAVPAFAEDKVVEWSSPQVVAEQPVCVDGSCAKTTEVCGPNGCPPDLAGEACCEPCGENCACDPCECNPPAAPVVEERSIVANREHLFNAEAAFMERGPMRKACKGVFGKVRDFIVNGGPIRQRLKARRGH